MKLQEIHKYITRCQRVFLVLAVVWMGVIFCFSSRNADESTEQSNAVGMLVGRIFVPDFEEWTAEKQLDFAEKWEFPIRKSAHMTEYAILGFLLVGTWTAGKRVLYKQTALRCLVVAMLYASTDEFHQYFVPGRACRIYDVGFDSAGALIGILVGLVAFSFVYHILTKKKLAM
jgi:VanZ family protein